MPSRRMAVITSIAFIYISRNLVMLIRQLLSVIVFVAIDTAEYLEIAGSGMAFGAVVPFSSVFPAVNGEIHYIVVKVCRNPCRFRVAALAVGWELSGAVAGVRRLVVIIGMAAKAGVRRVGVISIMAGRAIIRNGRMPAIKRIVIIVDAKRSRVPAWLGGVAGSTIDRQPQCLVVGVGAIAEISSMAGFTVRWRALVSGGVAQNAIGIQVPARERKMGTVVVKTAGRIPRRMAGQAGGVFISITAHPPVPLIRFRVDMAGDAHKFCVVRRVAVAIGTLRPFACMLPAIDRKQTVMLHKFGRHPADIRRVAFYTTGGKTRALVIGVKSIFIIRPVTGKAVGWRCGKVSCRMAIGAIRNSMPFFQWKKVVADAIGSPAKAIHTVTFLAVGRKTRLPVVGVCGCAEIIQVAIHTIIAYAVEIQGRFRNVAFLTTQGCMRPQKRKTIVLMQLGDVVHQPVRRSMATGAVRPNSGAVHIRMAGNALGTGIRKHQGLVALPAIHAGVLPFQRKSGGLVAEAQGFCIYFPTEGGVAVGTIGLEAGAVRRLRIKPGNHKQR